MKFMWLIQDVGGVCEEVSTQMQVEHEFPTPGYQKGTKKMQEAILVLECWKNRVTLDHLLHSSCPAFFAYEWHRLISWSTMETHGYSVTEFP